MDKATQDALNFIANDVGFGRHAFGHFMEAMKRGYASVPGQESIVEMPGFKQIEYTHAKWRVLDTYVVTPQSGYSGGNTVIWYGPVPVWMMQYLGYYDDAAIPCLKAALKQQHDSGKYYGGRGPEFFHHENDTYINRVEENNFLERTSGYETIFNGAGKKLGWHRYQAEYLVK